MPGEFNPEKYRKELADKLRGMRNSDPENSEIARAKAQGHLDAKKENEDYKEAEKYSHAPLPTKRKLEEKKLFLEDLNKKLSDFAKKNQKIGRFFENLEFVSPVIGNKKYSEDEIGLAYKEKPKKIFNQRDSNFILNNQELIPDFIRGVTIPIFKGEWTSYLHYDENSSKYYLSGSETKER